MLKLLAIGNSFSEDATCYLHQILKASGVESEIVNLYIGGCSLERHWKNIETNASEYMYQINGEKTERYVSIQEMLKEETWDYIVTHQASHDSGWENSYEPFMELILAYLKEKAPNSEIWLNETWAYEPDSDHNHFMRYHRDQEEMYQRLSACYKGVAAKYHLPLIPSGDLIQALRKCEPFVRSNNGRAICRDGFHMGYVYGRYAVASMWARSIFHISVLENAYIPVSEYLPGEEADMKILQVIKKEVEKI